MEGLAASVAQPQPQPQQGGGTAVTVEQVVELLLQGIPPEEIEASGVPREIIVQAIQMLEQRAVQQQQPQPSPAQSQGGGLAQQLVA